MTSEHNSSWGSLTRGEVARVLQSLSLTANHVVVHGPSSENLAVEGGARTICDLLMREVGDSGTVVMPAFTSSDTVLVGGAGAALKRAVAFHSDLSVDPDLGPLPEEFRRIPGVLRSSHPTHSFAAWGRQARDVLSTQRDNNPLGPLKKLNVLQGQLLLVGVSLRAASPIFLAEEGMGPAYLRRFTALRLNSSGYEERVVVENVPGCSIAFDRLEERIDPAKLRVSTLAGTPLRKIPIRYLVTLAARLLADDPLVFVCDRPDCAGCVSKREASGAPLPVAVAAGRS